MFDYITIRKHVEAIQFHGSNGNIIEKWSCGKVVQMSDCILYVKTQNDKKATVATISDYIVKDMNNDFSVLSEIEFRNTYEERSKL